MEIIEASDIIAAYMLRQGSKLRTSSNVDLIIRALNNAKKFAQRRHDFEMCRLSASVSVSPLPTGGSLTSAVEYGTSTAVSIKKIERIYITNDYGEAYPVHFSSRENQSSILQKRIDRGTIAVDDNNSIASNTSNPTLIQQGSKIYFYPDITTAKTVVLDVVKWLTEYSVPMTGTATSTLSGHLVDTAQNFVTKGAMPGDTVLNITDGTSTTISSVVSATDLLLASNIFTIGETYTISNGVDTDFLLEHCFDYLMYRSITELNFYLKDDQRVNISQGKMDEAWQSVLAWDSSLIPSTGEE